MRTCPKCGELNGDNNDRCYKCNTFIATAANTKKRCPGCGEVYNGNKNTCDYCGTTLLSYDENYYMNRSYGSNSDSNTWMYVCTFIIPLVGIILGCIKMSNDKRDDSGKSLITLGVALMVIYPVLAILFSSCGKA